MSIQRYRSWRNYDMEKAIFAYRYSDMRLNAVYLKYGIPKPSLKRHVEHKNKDANESIKHFSRCSNLPEIEKEFVEHVFNLESCKFGINTKDRRRLAFEGAEKNKRPIKLHQFKKDVVMVGKK